MSKGKCDIHKKNDKIFDLSRAVNDSLLQLMHEINKKHMKLFDLASHQRIFLFILTRSFKTYSSIRILCEHGFGQDASNLLRTLLENLVTVKYFLHDKKQSDELARRFVAYKWIILRRHLQEEECQVDLLDNVRVRDLANRQAVINQKVEDFKRDYKVTSDRALITWSGRTVRDMAKAASKDLLEEYEKTFRMCSRFSHPGILGDHEYMVQDGNHLIFSPTPSQIGVNINLLNAIKYAIDFIELTDDIFELAHDIKVASLKAEHVCLSDAVRLSLAETAVADSSANKNKADPRSIRKSIVLFKL